MPLSDARQQEIRTTLKRCSDETIAAALRYPGTLSDEDLDTIIRGVFQRDLPEDKAAGLATATDASRITQDIGMDSFGMIDVVMTAEEVLGISIENNDMRGLTTLGDLKQFLKAKTQGAA